MAKLYRNVYNKTHWMFHYLHTRKAYLSLLRRMERNLPKKDIHISKIAIQEYKRKWRFIDPAPSSKFFQIYSAVNGEVDLNYVPDYLYSFPIDGILSNFRYSSYTENKSLYKYRLGSLSNLLPLTYINKVNGLYLDSEYNPISDLQTHIRNINEEFIILKKGLDTSSGRDVFLLRRSTKGDYVDSKGVNLETLMMKLEDFVLQERVQQADFMAKFNNTSINTFRVVTYRSVTTNKVFVMQILLRRGKPGSFHDNLHSGGNLIPINNLGFLSGNGIDEKGNYIPNNIGLNRIPYYDDICKIALSIAEKDWFNRQLFFDFYIDREEKVRLMEINLTSFPTIQLYCGPAFGEFTDEVIEYCVRNRGNLIKMIEI